VLIHNDASMDNDCIVTRMSY